MEKLQEGKIYDEAQDKWRTKAELFFMEKLEIEEIPHNRVILDAFEIIEMIQEYSDLQMKVSTLRVKLLNEICSERENQDRKWGQQNHHPERWLSILVEEVGEASKEICEYNGKKYREEMIQVAAVALSMLECFDRNKYADHLNFNPSFAEAYNRNRPFQDQISEEWKGDDYAHLK